jgi:hypothetical protein
MPFFPQINSTGIITQIPYTFRSNFSTSEVTFPSGVKHTWGWRGMGLTNCPTGPLGSWELNYMAITDAEVAVLKTFYESMMGKLGEFIYLDPAGNLLDYSEDFTQWGTASGAVTDPFGGSRAMTASGTLSRTASGLAAGYKYNGSVWVKPTAQRAITIAVGSASKTVPCAGGVWSRIDCPATLAGTSGTVSISNLSSTGVFGAQLVPMPGPGQYARTPGNYGRHAKCRFDTDSFPARYAGPNQIQLKLPIVEYFG